MQTNSFLNEPLARECRITRFDANRGSRADAIEEPVTIGYQRHSKFRQELAVKGPGQVEAAYRQDDVGHAIYADHAHLSKRCIRASCRAIPYAAPVSSNNNLI